jgi:hypothetical protein
MNVLDLTPQQLKRAAAIKEQIQALNRELSRLLGETPQARATSARKRLSAKARKNIAAAQQARWAKFRASKTATRAARGPAKKKTMSAAAKANISAKMKARWAAKKAQKK